MITEGADGGSSNQSQIGSNGQRSGQEDDIIIDPLSEELLLNMDKDQIIKAYLALGRGVKQLKKTCATSHKTIREMSKQLDMTNTDNLHSLSKVIAIKTAEQLFAAGTDYNNNNAVITPTTCAK